MPEKETFFEKMERRKKEAISRIALEDCITTQIDATGFEYKALNMEKIRRFLPELEEKFNFIKNMSKDEILEFMHEEDNEDGSLVISYFPAEILKHMKPEYLKDDEFVEKILDAYITEYPYDMWNNNEYYLLAFPNDYPTNRINKNYKDFYDRLTSEQQAKFSRIVAEIEPALANNLKDAPAYFIEQYLWENNRFEEIFEYGVENSEFHIEYYAEEYLNMIEKIIQEDEEVVDSKKLELLSKAYTIKYGKNIEDDEKWTQLLQQNKLLGLWKSRDLDKIEEYMDENFEDNFAMDYLYKKIENYIAKVRELMDDYEDTQLDEMSEEELERIIADNEKKISANNKTIRDGLVGKILSQQQIIAGQEKEIARLTTQKSKES